MMDHVLLTRFNLPSGGIEARIRANNAWLQSRWQLFEQYCAPSVANQTSGAYRWIIYFDPESPDWLRDRITPYVADGLFTPIYRAEVPHVTLLRDLESVTSNNSEGLITTNLDNDDALALDFVERVQAAADPTSRHAIYLINGLIKAPRGLYARTDRDNAFCSVAEPWDSPQTCWSDWHNRLRRAMPVTEVNGAPGWLQVVHGNNVSNRVRGSLISPDQWTTLFSEGLLEDIDPPTTKQVLLDRAIAGPLRSIRDAARSGARRAGVAVLGKQRAQSLRARLPR